MTKKILLVGCGNIGRRLVEAIALTADVSREEIFVTVVERSPQSRSQAEAQFEKLKKAPFFCFELSEYDAIADKKFDLAIIATDSRNRFSALQSVLERTTVKKILLEKFLYSKASDYQSAQTLLEKNGVEAWVNCARNVWPDYLKLRESLPASPTRIRVSGSDWGLGCNGIHFLALIEFLTKTPVVSLRWDDGRPPVVRPAKREGYLEVTGTMVGNTGSQCDFEIASLDSDVGPITIDIDCADTKVRVVEAAGTQEWQRNDETDSFPFAITHTSQLVGGMRSLLSGEKITFPEHDEASQLHLKMIATMNLAFFGDSDTERECPIT